jgi:phosphoglycerol transferase MdoB-like AlkP superfamily enzyme
MYGRYIKQVFAFTGTGELVILSSTWVITSAAMYALYHKIAGNYFQAEKKPFTLQRLSVLLYIPLILVGFRGGFQYTPLNESSVYYSSFAVNNSLAMNIPWHLAFSLLDETDTKNPFVAMPESKAKNIIQRMTEVRPDSAIQILTTKRPNVIIIMLESWTAALVKELGGDSATTPCFDTLRKHGLLFTQAYASGSRTDQGLASIISGFPSQPNRSIINMPEKAKKLPYVTDSLVKHGYHISFYHGGEADYANMKIYLQDAHFDKIIDRAMFPEGKSNGTLGVNDEYVFSRQLKDLGTGPQPFFSLLMTLSSHEPFEVPSHHNFPGTDEYNKFRNAVYYTDSCLAMYLKEASKQKWYDSTLFILVSDHGHCFTHITSLYSPTAHHITMMFYGGALKTAYRGKEISTTTDQADIAAMLYTQMGFNHSEFPWSIDALNPTAKHFTIYSNDLEAGIISGGQHLQFTLYPDSVVDYNKGPIARDSLFNCAKAWIQLYYQQYLNY